MGRRRIPPHQRRLAGKPVYLSTLGSYALGVLEGDWADYIRFHLEVVGCEYCAAHLHDISRPEQTISESARRQIFTSSAGFLK